MQHLDINMAEEEINIEADAIALEDSEDSTATDYEVENLVDHEIAQFKKSEDYRYEDELRWTRAYRNYRGLYGPDVQFTEAENKINQLLKAREGDTSRVEELEKKRKDDLLKLEKIIMPLLKNLQKNPDDVYIKWPNRKEVIEKQIKKIVAITRS